MSYTPFDTPRPYIRHDDRICLPVRELDFTSPDTAAKNEQLGMWFFAEGQPTAKELLEPGLEIGCNLRFYRGGHYRTLWLQGQFEGERRTINVPNSKYHPRGPSDDVEVPVFDLEIVTPQFRRVSLGSIAVGYLRPHQTPLTDPLCFEIGDQQSELPSIFGLVGGQYRLGIVTSANISCVPVYEQGLLG